LSIVVLDMYEKDLGRYDSVENRDAFGTNVSEINRDTGRSLGIVGSLHRNGGAGVMMTHFTIFFVRQRLGEARG
jgi:hypothetical protein